jgi:sugar phosphate isomerase/epimerase
LLDELGESGALHAKKRSGAGDVAARVGQRARDAVAFDLAFHESGRSLDLVEKLCQEYQIRVAIHNHPKPSRYWNPETVLAAVKGRSPLMGSCADIGHWMRSGLEPLECIRMLEGRVICLHFKDLNAKDPEAHDVPWGTGAANSKGIMAELKRQKFHGAFCIEYEYHWENSLPEIAQCVQFFNATCVELATDLPVKSP